MLEEKFAEGSSFIHKLDPRIKVISCIVFIFSVASLTNFYASVVAFLLGVIFLLLANLIKKKTILTLIKINGFILFLWCVIPFSAGGEKIFSFWKLSVTKEGIDLCLLLTLKSNAILMSIISMLLTQPAPVLGKALSCLKFPSKFVFLLLISYRYINLIYEEYNRLMTAAKLRGFVPKTNFKTYKTIGYIFSMVLIKSYDRAERIYKAMVLRGFKGKFYTLYEFSASKKDYIFCGATILLSLFLVAIELKGDYILGLWRLLSSI